MVATAARLLTPEVLLGIRDLRLAARTLVDGFLAGQHLDPRPAQGVEFSQYRAYTPGDDLRQLDWRVLGRSDRLVVREAEVERDVVVRVVLDASASMGHRDGAITKLDHARLLAAAIGHLADRQGDRLSMFVVRQDGVEMPRPGSRSRALERAITMLERIEAGGRWPDWGALAPHFTAGTGWQRRELVVMVSDLYQHHDELTAVLRALRAQRHEVLLLHVVARNELDLDFRGDVVFEDLETGETVRADAASMRESYLARLDAHLDAWRRRALDLGVAYARTVTDEPLDRVLRTLLDRRGQVA